MGKPKKVNFELIPDQGSQSIYGILEEIRNESHEDLEGAKIALAWRRAFKPDKDGHLVLGKCCKASDLQRALVDWDFVILLNEEVWNDPDFTLDKKKALIDHELCHAAPALDKDGEQKVDEKDRLVWRVRKHDIEEFREIVERHGCYKSDLEAFAEALLKRKEPTLEFAGKV